MAKNMGHEGVGVFECSYADDYVQHFTLTGWLYIMKCFGLV